MYIEGKYINGTDNLSLIHQIREKVFGYSVIPTDHYYDTDTGLISDLMAIHAVARMENTVVGCGTLFYDGETFVLDGIAVPEEERRKKYGDFIVRMLLDRAFRSGAKEIILYCPEQVKVFFDTLGFQKKSEKVVNGEKFLCLSIEEKYVCKECKHLS